MKAQERAAAIGLLFLGSERDGVIEAGALEGVRQQVLTAQRDALVDYQAVIQKYGWDNGYARIICDRLVQLGDVTLDQYK